MRLKDKKPLLAKAAFTPFLFLLIGVSALVFKTNHPGKQHFIVSDIGNGKSKAVLFESSLIPQPQFLLASHSATVEVLPNGNLIALWFAGSHEGKPDVKIWQSYFDGKSWSVGQDVVSPEIISKDTHRFIKKVGNPVVYKAQDGKLHLFVVSVSIGGWSGSSLNHFISNDLGKTWQKAHKLILTPFINISTLNRTKAIGLSDGGFYLPVYHEFMRTYPEMLRFDKNGKFIEQTRLNSQNTLLQPALLPLSESHAFSYYRNNTRRDKVLYYQETFDGGETWSRLAPTNLENQDSSLVVAEIKPDQFIMLHNIGSRNRLALAVSKDGKKWVDVYLLENGKPDNEFSYPAIQVHDGLIDILYTWKRNDIKHVRFNSAWLDKKILRGDINVK